MAKKKKLKFGVKLNKARRKRLKAVALPVIVGLLCLNIGIIGTRFLESRKVPGNIVWAADDTVVVPRDLRKFLGSQDDCKNYRGTDSPTGVGLWGVYQVSRGKFAKIAYGCSWSLSSYIMAVKEDSGWTLLQPTEYFAPFQGSSATGALPLCDMVEKYKINSSIEPFCIAADGTARANQLK
jgi:hypothetical protein